MNTVSYKEKMFDKGGGGTDWRDKKTKKTLKSRGERKSTDCFHRNRELPD